MLALDSGIAMVLGALISGVAAIVGIILKLRDENRSDHAHVVRHLERLGDTVERVEAKIDEHIVDHSRGLM